MPSGKVKFFDVAKGYGFLVPDEGGGDVFVHMRQVRRGGLKQLVPGEILTYEVTEERGRPEAVALARVPAGVEHAAPEEQVPAAAPIAVPVPEAAPVAAPRVRRKLTLALDGKKPLESGPRSD